MRNVSDENVKHYKNLAELCEYQTNAFENYVNVDYQRIVCLKKGECEYDFNIDEMKYCLKKYFMENDDK